MIHIARIMPWEANGIIVLNYSIFLDPRVDLQGPTEGFSKQDFEDARGRFGSTQ